MKKVPVDFIRLLKAAAENHSMRLLAAWNGVPLIYIGHSIVEGGRSLPKGSKVS